MDLTIISSYFDKSPRETLFVRWRVNHYFKLKEKYPKLKMILVDDGSQSIPVEKALENLDLTGITLVKIKEDLGFNSHGARNLGMHISKSEWNFLIDLDVDLLSIDLDLALPLDPNTIYKFDINAPLIHKNAFWSVKGYDEDFVNIHYGDKIFFSNLERIYPAKDLRSIVRPKHYRLARKVILSNDHLKTDYDDKEEKMFFQPAERYKALPSLISIVQDRYDRNDFSQKKVLNFTWEIVKQKITLA